MIEGVKITELKQIKDRRGKIMHMLRSDSKVFKKFGEIYFSTINPGIVKAWHLHKEMTLNYAVIYGEIKFVLYDDRKNSSTYKKIHEVYMGDNNYVRVTVPPGVWNGFMGIGTKESFVVNFTDIPHDPSEIHRMDPHENTKIEYDWSVKDR